MTVLAAVGKNFFYLRAIDSLSKLVTMITNVIYDLRIFLFVYSILIFSFSQFFGVLGVGNPDVPGNFHDEYYEDSKSPGAGLYPMGEYKQLGNFLGGITMTLRFSLGDNDFAASEYLNFYENLMFWSCWLFVSVMCCIIFLNFIIAEAGASYERIVSQLNAMVLKERVELIAEAESVFPDMFKRDTEFPKYIAIR